MPTETDSAALAAHEVVVGLSRLRRRLLELAVSEDLTPSQMSVLSRLAKGGASSASALATEERVRPQSMATTLAALGRLGLVQRSPDPTDGRRQLVTLTDDGEQSVVGQRAARRQWLGTALREHCTEAELVALVDAMAVLERVTEA